MTIGQSHYRTAPSVLGSGRNAVLLVAVGFLLAKGWHALSRARQLQENAHSARLPERLQTWEGEGGRAPAEAASETGAATNPDAPNASHQ